MKRWLLLFLAGLLAVLPGRLQAYMSHIATTVPATGGGNVTAYKIFGPDLNGRYGGLQGTGGLEAVITKSGSQPYRVGVLSDLHGVLQGTVTLDGSAAGFAWLPEAGKLSAYGSTPTVALTALSGASASAALLPAAVVEASAWRGRRVDASGRICLGARWYDPMAGRFLSPDPLGHGASWDLYSYAGGDPLNLFDPDGRSPGWASWLSMDSISKGWGAALRMVKDLHDYYNAAVEGASEGLYNATLAPFVNAGSEAGQLYFDAHESGSSGLAAFGYAVDYAGSRLSGGLGLLEFYSGEKVTATQDGSLGTKTFDNVSEWAIHGAASYAQAGASAVGIYGLGKAGVASFSQAAAEGTAGRTVFSGHGALVVGDSSPVTALPQGSSLTFWTEHGNSISDALGNAIETGGRITVEQFPEAAGARSYLPGSFVPNYTLYPPTGLNIMGNPLTVSSPTSLGSLLRPGMGNVNWAACRNVIAP